ncbi:MAG: 4-(cytidine 5'-diphospho)-2-C-methyl-D-erythritol kinase, partial [Candidatus Margulisiibacteriota bacterium]
LGVRPDGFHEIESIMQSVSLFDEVKCVEIHRNAVEIRCSDKNVPAGESNICYKAVELIRKKCGVDKGVRIDIIKNIPMEAGLGGGSSNAAAVLIGLNKMWNLKLSDDELIVLAAEVGSDVPFFIVGGRCLCRGRGEIIEKILNPKFEILNKSQITNFKQQNFYIIIKPDVSVSTKWAYEGWDRTQNTEHGAQNTEHRAQNTEHRAQNTDSDLEPVVIKKYPIIGEIKQVLLESGCTSARMTGSGSAVFGICRDKERGRGALIKIKEKYPRSFLVSAVKKGCEVLS